MVLDAFGGPQVWLGKLRFGLGGTDCFDLFLGFGVSLELV